MKYYLEIKAKPSEDLAPEIIISQAFSICHLELVRLKSDDVGVSFPQADKSLGGVMRIHGGKAALESIGRRWVSLSDYCQISPCREVPSDCGWRDVKRVQPKWSTSKIRRLVKRGSITAQDAEERLNIPPNLGFPYVQIRSRSSGQNFRIFVSQESINSDDKFSTFNSYGLGGSVPWF